MTFLQVSRGSLLGLVTLLLGASMPLVRAQGPDLGSEAQRQAGKTLYLKYCAQCHGEAGDGDAYGTPHLLPKPRNFTSGKFKVRSTPTGALPTHQDIVNIIRRGMPYTSMPAWPNLSQTDLSNLAYFIKTFSADFANPEIVPQPVPLPGAPGMTTESVEAGKKLYEETGCIRCHGNLGRGDGPSAPTLKDDWGYPVRAADLSQSWTFRGGSSREDIFRTMTTGFNGTPMPGFLDALTPEQRWAITDYIVSLSGTEGPRYTNLVIAKHVEDPIDLARGAALFESAPVARFPIVGQIVEPGRAFRPAATSVMVQAVYDAESIALLVRWHDMSAERSGANGPSLPVPLEEEEVAAAAAAPAAADAGGVFGDAEVEPGAEAQDPFAEDAAPAAPTSEFSDAVAVQLPSQFSGGARRPYFIFGDAQEPVDLWFFDLARSGASQYTGKGSADIAPNDTGEVTGVASYDEGEWSVIFTRPLRPTSGVPMVAGTFVPVAFSVWDGLSRERGNRRGLSAWYHVYIEPADVPSPLVPMIQTALTILVIELALIGWVRWRYGTRRGEELAGRPGQQPAASA